MPPVPFGRMSDVLTIRSIDELYRLHYLYPLWLITHRTSGKS